MFEVKYEVTDIHGKKHICKKCQIKSIKDRVSCQKIYRRQINIIVDERDLEWLDERLSRMQLVRSDLIRYIMNDHDLVNAIIERYKKKRLSMQKEGIIDVNLISYQPMEGVVGGTVLDISGSPEGLKGNQNS